MGMALPRLCCSYQVKNRFGRVWPSHLFCFYFFRHSLFFSSSCFLVSLCLFFTSLLFTIFLPLNVFPLETELKSYLFTGARLSAKCTLCCVESRLEALVMDIRRKDFFTQYMNFSKMSNESRMCTVIIHENMCSLLKHDQRKKMYFCVIVLN